MAAHAILGASSMGIWSRCAAMPQFVKGMPDSKSVYAAEGTVAHGLGEAMIAGKKPPPAGTKVLQEGFEIEVTDDMLFHARRYADLIDDMAANADIVQVEVRLSLEEFAKKHGIHFPDWPLFGTADALIYDEALRHLFVVDLKYGAGVAVSAVENLQALYYALAALTRMLAQGKAVTAVTVVIYQPRVHDEPSRWTLTALDILMWGESVLVPAVKAAVGKNPAFKSGDHCRFCNGRTSCPQLHRDALEAAKMEFSDTPPATDGLSDTELADALDKAGIMETWIRAVRAEASARLDRGTPIPGYKLVAKRAVRKWTDPAGVFNELTLRGYPPDDLENRSMKSVAAIEKLMKQNGDALPKDWFSAESSGTTLVPDKDARPAQGGPSSDFDSI